MNSKKYPLFEEIDIEPTDEELQAIEEDAEDFPEIEEGEFKTNSNNIFAKYLREISHYPSLTREEEISLAKKIKLHRKSAFEQFFNSNAKLVVKIARKYSTDDQHLKLPDLIQEGNIGLMVAVKKYDWKRGFKFSTYGTWWIKRFIHKAVNTMNLEDDFLSDRDRLQKQIAEYSERMDRASKISKRLKEAIGALSEEAKMIFFLMADKNLKPSEIEEKTGIKECNVKRLYYSAKGKLSRNKGLAACK